MATQISSLPAFFNTDADFRNWGKGISDVLAAQGLVKTADTGQVDWTTVAKPAATNTSQGYEIWRFDDAAQATLPVYIKLEYGSGSANDRPSIWYTVGTGSNGSGTLTGQLGTRTQKGINSSKTAGAVLNSYFCCSSGRMMFVTNLDPGSNAFSIMLLIDRPCDSSGVAQTDCFVAMAHCAFAGMSFQLIPASGTIGTLSGSVGPWANPGGGSNISTDGSNTALVPGVVFKGRTMTLRSALAYAHADLGELSSFSVTFLGASHTFLPIGDGLGGSPFLVRDTTPTPGLAILWE